jgi:hypothetical protein
MPHVAKRPTQSVGERSRREREEATMRETKALVALAASAALVVLGVTSATAADHENARDRSGSVRPCSLDGVNPAYHPDIFANPAAAKSYGFVLGPDRSWHVRAGCSPFGH